MSKRLFIGFVVSSFVVLAASARQASAFEVSYNSDCCCEDVNPCSTGSANAMCVPGHRGDDSTMGACNALDFFPFARCFGKSCISLGETCHADAGPSSYTNAPPFAPAEVTLNGVDDDCDLLVDECAAGSTLACTTNLRSCAGTTGSVMCGANGFPASACTPDPAQVMNPDMCPKAACKGGVINNTDSDSDGLFDCWETEGIDYDGDGTIDFTLPNANPRRIDIYVESDYFDCTVAGGDCAMGDMHQHGPTAQAQADIVAAFANSPIINRDTSTGITLHLLVDEALPHQNNCYLDGTCYEPIKGANFGTAAERANPTVRLAKRLVYRYSIWGHMLAANDKHSGLAYQPSGDLIVTLGSTNNVVGTAFEQAATFVHELGHQLSLAHGGGDEINFKPNYLSVMNYAFQFRGISPGMLIDYSHVALPQLVETALVEDDGIFDATHGTRFRCPNFDLSFPATGDPVNWDCLPLPNTATDILSSDINGDRICIKPGVDNALQSAAAGDDLVRNGFIGGGADLILNSQPPVGDDFVQNSATGLIVMPGPNRIIDTPRTGDDQILGQVIWDGANRTCESAIVPDDVADDTNYPARAVGSVQPPGLNGFNDWDSLRYEFSDLLHGFMISNGATPFQPVEMTTDQMVEAEQQAQVADLKLTQALSRSPDGNAVVQLTLLNQGPAAAIMPTINDRLPAEITFRSCVATGGGACTVKDGFVVVSFASLASGASAAVTITGCTTANAAITNVASVSALSTDPNPANNKATGQLASPFALPAHQLANGSMRYAITFTQQQAYVEAFVRVNGVQTIAGNIVGSKVTNPDGTFTYSRVVTASSYHAGDVINVRFYAYRAGQPGVYFPGPVENLSYPDFIYGAGSGACSTACRPTYKQMPNGDVKLTRTLSTPQTYIEAFVRDGATQVAAGNIVQSGVANLDGTFTYSRVVPGASFHAGNAVTFRYYSYVTPASPVFAPGPTATTWFPGFRYNQPPTSDCP